MSNNNNNQDAELQNLENMMNSMMQGAFSLLFKDFGGQIFEQSSITNHPQLNNAPLLDDFEGSDFRRLAKKSKNNRRAEELVREEREIVPTREIAVQNEPMSPLTTGLTGLLSSALYSTIGSVFNQLSHFPGTMEMDVKSDKDNSVNGQGVFNWNYSSSKTTTSSDGTQVTTTTKKSNGMTETIKRIQHPNGDVEESREITQG
ncbi:hypothetical protein G6F56_006672 [Rhizopus delemar]|uniref:Uncharacterized protein n=1 Tax=Rhizopus stolonifer TaxID=4846 RepID=A0A367KVY8_RHIST|nr:hypothetical protein G6F56_006672 [Rhizopus delemar]RCI06373.1 hypothetical protein CU098_011750 [Rhizopus stolonifer]